MARAKHRQAQKDMEDRIMIARLSDLTKKAVFDAWKKECEKIFSAGAGMSASLRNRSSTRRNWRYGGSSPTGAGCLS